MKHKSQNKLVGNIISLIFVMLMLFSLIMTTITYAVNGVLLIMLIQPIFFIAYAFTMLSVFALAVLNFISLFRFGDKSSFIICTVTVVCIVVIQACISVFTMVSNLSIIIDLELNELQKIYISGIINSIINLLIAVGFVVVYFVCSLKLPAENKKEETTEPQTNISEEPVVSINGFKSLGWANVNK